MTLGQTLLINLIQFKFLLGMELKYKARMVQIRNGGLLFRQESPKDAEHLHHYPAKLLVVILYRVLNLTVSISSLKSAHGPLSLDKQQTGFLKQFVEIQTVGNVEI